MNAMAMICLVYVFFTGHRLMRVIAWIFLWQLLTPTRDTLIDLTLLVTGFIIVEFCYLKTKVTLNNKAET